MAFRTNKTPVLQEKSASGAVATFNTALAMPLASCDIAVNAWQEGSGDPSPSNVRAIHGFSEVNITANNVIHIIQFGQEVYGAEVDVVNGVAHCTWKKDILNNPNPLLWAFFETFDQFYNTTYFSGDDIPLGGKTNLMCETLKPCDTSERDSNVGNFIIVSSSGGVSLSFPDVHTKEDAIAYVNNNPITFIYKLAEPFDIQLTPTQIETLIGNNTIFADTGDISLTYKDLDIAKRGSFREVFKLPS